jgi:hypothetical protein
MFGGRSVVPQKLSGHPDREKPAIFEFVSHSAFIKRFDHHNSLSLR